MFLEWESISVFRSLLLSSTSTELILLLWLVGKDYLVGKYSTSLSKLAAGGRQKNPRVQNIFRKFSFTSSVVWCRGVEIDCLEGKDFFMVFIPKTSSPAKMAYGRYWIGLDGLPKKK